MTASSITLFPPDKQPELRRIQRGERARPIRDDRQRRRQEEKDRAVRRELDEIANRLRIIHQIIEEPGEPCGESGGIDDDQRR